MKGRARLGEKMNRIDLEKWRGALRLRRLALAALVVLPMVGASAGALAGVDGTWNSTEVTVQLQASAAGLNGDSRRARARLRYIASFASSSVLPAHLRRQTRTWIDEATGVIYVAVRAREKRRATESALDIAQRLVGAAEVAVRSVGPRTERIGTFEHGLGGWSTLQRGSRPSPTKLVHRSGSAKDGSGFLRLSCAQYAGCAVFIDVTRPLDAPGPRQGVAFARSSVGSPRIRLVISPAGHQRTLGEPVRLSAKWRPVTVRWHTENPTVGTSMIIERIGVAPRTFFDVDRVTVSGPDHAVRPLPPELRRIDEIRAVELGRYASVVNARTTDAHGPGPAVPAVSGGAAGLFVALCAIASGAAASARRLKSERLRE